MSKAHSAKGNGSQDHQIGKRRVAFYFFRIGRNFFLQIFNSRRIGFEPSVDLCRFSNTYKDDRHPDVGHNNIYKYHPAVQRLIIPVDLEHGSLVGTTAYPTSS